MRGEGCALRLITGLDDLAGLDLDTSATVSEVDVAPFRVRLQAMADAEFRLTAQVAEVEADNQRSGRAQASLALGTAFLDVNVAHVLEAEIVRDFAGRQEGVVAEVTSQERQAIEGDGVELSPVGDGLFR